MEPEQHSSLSSLTPDFPTLKSADRAPFPDPVAPDPSKSHLAEAVTPATYTVIQVPSDLEDAVQLRTVTIERFRNFVSPQTFSVEEDVTCLVGKNESGKTTILKALHRLNPANGESHEFDLTTEYPRWLLSRDKRDGLGHCAPVQASFALDDEDRAVIADALRQTPPPDTVCIAGRTYSNELQIRFECDGAAIVHAAAEDASVSKEDAAALAEAASPGAAAEQARALAKELKDDDAARAKCLKSFPKALEHYGFLNRELDDAEAATVQRLLPQFFYFSNYDTLPGEIDLHALAKKVAAGEQLAARDQVVVALLAYAGEEPKDFLDENYDARKAELQAASLDLSRKVFDYWRSNRDLAVVFDTDMPIVGKDSEGRKVRHRFLKIELRDDRHGGVETNFATRSAGFQWFFSFLAAFSRYLQSAESVIVLLDEPGTSLHGEAQADFVRFIFEELGQSKQVMYTTHSQHMIEPARYEKLRAVEDTSTRDNPDLGVAVGFVDLHADRDTVLPVEAALGYTISQHLFLGSGHHLVVEGSSDFVFLQRISDELVRRGRVGLDPKFAIIPVGSADNAPAFVALLGRRLKVSVLLDGERLNRTRDRVLAAARSNAVPEDAIVVCSEVGGVPRQADIEDLFAATDYLRLYGLAVGPLASGELPETGEPILRRIEQVRGKFDHALPAHALTQHQSEFFEDVEPVTLDRFETLFQRLNGTLETDR